MCNTWHKKQKDAVPIPETGYMWKFFQQDSMKQLSPLFGVGVGYYVTNENDYAEWRYLFGEEYEPNLGFCGFLTKADALAFKASVKNYNNSTRDYVLRRCHYEGGVGIHTEYAFVCEPPRVCIVKKFKPCGKARYKTLREPTR